MLGMRKAETETRKTMVKKMAVTVTRRTTTPTVLPLPQPLIYSTLLLIFPVPSQLRSFRHLYTLQNHNPRRRYQALSPRFLPWHLSLPQNHSQLCPPVSRSHRIPFPTCPYPARQRRWHMQVLPPQETKHSKRCFCRGPGTKEPTGHKHRCRIL